MIFKGRLDDEYEMDEEETKSLSPGPVHRRVRHV
jgi:hypothetical protein